MRIDEKLLEKPVSSKLGSEPIAIEALRTILTNCLSSDLLAFHLQDGDILLGGIPRGGGLRDDTVNIAFNAPDGKRYGVAQYVRIPTSLIASVTVVPLSDATIPPINQADRENTFVQRTRAKDMRLPVHNFPNPLAKILYDHNMPIVESHGFSVSKLIEESLSQAGISGTGIHFDRDFLMYADWEFFETQAKGETNIAVSPLPGLVQLERVIRSSNEELVIARLRNSLSNRISSLLPSLGEYRILMGVLLVPEPLQDEEIEGETCYLYRVATSEGEQYPVLIKAKKLKYPRSFLNRVSSQMAFYGEMLPIPVSVAWSKYNDSMLVRAIASLTS